MYTEDKLMELDFSRFSKVRDSLKTELLQRFDEELSMEELDSVAAARGGQRSGRDGEYHHLRD